MLELYYYPDNASLAPHLLLAETGADYALKLVDRSSYAQKSKEYLKLNLAGRIPHLCTANSFNSKALPSVSTSASWSHIAIYPAS